MLASIFISATVLVGALAAPKPLEACSEKSAQPCSCPKGTDYNTATTYLTVGANAFDVRNLTADFYDLGWIPQSIKETHGPDNEIGSTRLTVIAIDVGVYEWVEELTRYELGSDGSFLWAFKCQNMPLKFHPGPGMFAGEWISMKAEYVSEHETLITWNLYGCHSGGMHRYSEFQRMILLHVNEQLAEAGKIQGSSQTPWSEIGKPREMTLGSSSAAVSQPVGPALQHPFVANEPSQHWPERWTAL